MQSLVELAAYTAAAAAVTALGVLVELQSLVRFAAGEASVGAWLAIFGLILLYAGVYLLGYGQVVPRLDDPVE